MALNGWPAYSLSGHRVPAMRFPLAASQTFVAGNLVVLDASGDVAECGADPTEILGMAAENAADVVESGYVMVYVATDDAIFALQPSAGTITEAAIGEDYGVVLSDSVWMLDLTDTSNVSMFVVDIDISRNLAFCKVLSTVRTLG